MADISIIMFGAYFQLTYSEKNRPILPIFLLCFHLFYCCYNNILHHSFMIFSILKDVYNHVRIGQLNLWSALKCFWMVAVDQSMTLYVLGNCFNTALYLYLQVNGFVSVCTCVLLVIKRALYMLNRFSSTELLPHSMSIGFIWIHCYFKVICKLTLKYYIGVYKIMYV